MITREEIKVKALDMWSVQLLDDLDKAMGLPNGRSASPSIEAANRRALTVGRL